MGMKLQATGFLRALRSRHLGDTERLVSSKAAGGLANASVTRGEVTSNAPDVVCVSPGTVVL